MCIWELAKKYSLTLSALLLTVTIASYSNKCTDLSEGRQALNMKHVFLNSSANDLGTKRYDDRVQKKKDLTEFLRLIRDIMTVT